MTTDTFTDAAEDAAEEHARTYIGTDEAAYGYHGGFTDGAEWARARLAVQEPTDAECLAVLNVAIVPLGEPPKRNDLADWNPAAVERVRAALSAARKA